MKIAKVYLQGESLPFYSQKVINAIEVTALFQNVVSVNYEGDIIRIKVK
jgi:hypothetical protein